MDFLDAFSLVAKLVTVKVLLALAACFNWHLIQLNVNNAFLNGNLFAEIYIDLPLCYGSKGETSDLERKLVCKPHKSIHGLKQASRQWYSKLSQSLVQFGFTQSKYDSFLFTKGSDPSFVPC